MEWIEIKPGDDGRSGEAAVRFPPSAQVFAGHFPHRPILPGVVLIDTAVSIVAKISGRPLRLAALANVKFVSPVEADQEIRFAFRAEPDPAAPGRIRVKGRWSRGADKIAEMQFAAAEEGGSHGA